MRRAALAAVLAAVSFGTRAMSCPEVVHVSLPNFPVPPFVLGSDRVEAKPGLLIEWLRGAYGRTGCPGRFEIVRRPPNRQLAELELGRIDILPGFAFAPDLLRTMVFPMRGGDPNPDQALMADTVSLYARAGDVAVKWDGKVLGAPNPRVGTSTGGALAVQAARLHHWELESAATPLADLRKLAARRVDVILEPDVVMTPLMSLPEAAGVRKLTPPVHLSRRYAPVRRAFAEKYPEFTQAFWLELCRQSRVQANSMPACR
ncbi:MAG TPA: hypothetical protein VFF16_21310 [Telluria sp.]|nr:hypothetical protein [Telluria sp.]